jgi:AraC-like DNA-binding protein
MNAYYLKPSDKIAEYVQEILVLENEGSTMPFELNLFANGTPTLLFQTAKGRIKNNSNYLTLFGQTIAPEKLSIIGCFTLIAYFLKPHAIISLFQISAAELTDNPIDFDLLSHRHKANLKDQLLNATSTTAMLSLVDEYIFKLANRVAHEIPLIRYAADKIFRDPYPNILKELQKELYLTERTFQRSFERNVGVSPNQFRRICQFNNSFQQLNRHRSESLSAITYQNHYADQSHFIRTFREFTTLTPGEYISSTS